MSNLKWRCPPQFPQLHYGEVHIWRAFLHGTADFLSGAMSILSEEEKTRAERFVQEQHCRRFIVAHVALREILSRYLKIPPTDICFSKGPHGKPFLVGSSLDLKLQFNASDSHELALYAITKDYEVGIDVEHTARAIDVESIAQRFFSKEEVQQLIGLPEEKRLAGFYYCWTRKEAYIKMIGDGLAFPLHRFVVSLQPEVGMNALLQVDDDSELVKKWSLGSILSAQGYSAALAVKGKVDCIQYFDWNSPSSS